ncbi:MAG TPA: CAP domain-containing protein [Thermoleophilaceae bacterium]|nr:CAP domain-containing protein [Thermoleophilaceae bacterium]
MARLAHSARGWLVAGLLAALAAAALPAPAAAQNVTERVEEQIRKCANSERAKRGLPRLAHNAILDKAARFHAKNMAKNDFFSHDDPQGRGPAQRIDIFGSWEAFNGIGENIAAGRNSPAQTCQDWMESPGHRENILDSSFRAIGGGFAIGDTELRFYYVQEFGERNVGGAPPKPSRPSDQGPEGPPVVMRLFNAKDSMSLSVDGRRLVTVRPGQARAVELGRLSPDTRITVEAFSSSGELSWGIEQKRGDRVVYRDARAIGHASTSSTVELATGPEPLVHRVTLNARGRVLESSSPDAPASQLWDDTAPPATAR